ncbi:MAG: tetratricopeptide repeat protein [Sphingosinicella sp.]
MRWRRGILLAGLIGMAFSSPGLARTDPAATLSTYARARAASAAGADDEASRAFAAALAADPSNEVIAAEALSHAVLLGEWPLALRAAANLEARGALLPDARFLLVADTLRRRDWNAAIRQVDAIERERLFANTVPVLRAWIALGRGRDALADLATPGLAGAELIAEHRPLLYAASGRGEEAAALLLGTEGASIRRLRLRLAAAGALAARNERAAARALLQGSEGPLVAARTLVESGRPLPGAVDDPAAGFAELMVRLAIDMQGEDLLPVAASFAHLATWAAPDNSQAAMVAAELLSRLDRPLTAQQLLAAVAWQDPFAAAARDQRARLLVETGELARVLGDAESVAAASRPAVADLVRAGEIFMGQDRAADAARAFARAVELRGEGDSDYPVWALWLMRGGAHDEAGDWPAARDALREAHRLAPAEPLVLNYLGYAMLVRREQLDEARRLIREAHRLAPANAAITDSLGWALFVSGDVAGAIPLLELAAAEEAADAEINEHLGDAYFTAGRRIEARFAWAAARVYASGEQAERLAAKIDRGLTPQLAAR